MGLKFSSNEKFFDTWSPEMAYVLGYIVADGNLLHSPNIRGHYVKITSTDIERLKYFKKVLDSEHAIHQQTSTGKKIFVLRIGSKKLFASLERHGLTPKKSLTAVLPTIPKRYCSHFVRGYFDGDGCVFIERALGAHGAEIDKALRIIFTSGSKVLLDEFNALIGKELKIHKNILNAKRSFQIRYGTTDSILLFTYLYSDTPPGAFMARKYITFKKYFLRRADQVSNEMQTVLEYMNGLMVKR